MEERTTRRDLALIGLLVLVAVALRAWHLCHTEVAARDSIGYIRYAWQLGHHPWIETIADPKQDQHFGYPFAVLAMSYPVRQFISASDSVVMQLSAQLASSMASVLLVVPMFFLGRDLFGRGVGFWTTLIVQCLPAAGRIFADGLSEGLFLLFATTALLGAVRAFRNHSPSWFALTGLFGSLAYLVRPEGALIVVATALVLLAGVRSQRRFLASAAALGLTAVLVGCPLYAITGKLTVKPTANQVWGHDAPQPGHAAAGISVAPPFAVWIFQEGNQDSLWGARAVGEEFIKGSHQILWLPMVLGLWWYRDRFRLIPGSRELMLVSVLILLSLWRVASLLGYVSDRHLLLPVLCGTYWAVAAVPRIVTALTALIRRLGWMGALGRRLPAATSPVWEALVLAGFVVATLPKLLEPLHANRQGFRDAGLWIAAHSRPWDAVMDPYSWSHYYAGKVFLEDESPRPPPGETKVCYVVLETAGPEHLRLKMIQQAQQSAALGRKVWERPIHRGKDIGDVTVYETPMQ